MNFGISDHPGFMGTQESRGYVANSNSLRAASLLLTNPVVGNRDCGLSQYMDRINILNQPLSISLKSVSLSYILPNLPPFILSVI